ncbi:hypothetical protein D3C80_847730 [compost metagenome]
MRLIKLVGQGNGARLVAGQHCLDHWLVVGPRLGGRHRADDKRRALFAALQRAGQAIDQGGDTEVVDRDDQAAGRCGDTEAGAAHQAVQHAVATGEYVLDRRLATFGGGQVGDDLGVGAVDADDLVAGGAQGGAHRSADARRGTADSCDWHENSPE